MKNGSLFSNHKCIGISNAEEIKKGGRVGDDKLKKSVLHMRKVFEQWQQQRSEQAFDRNREERRRVKAVVREAKREAEDRFGIKLSQNFEVIGRCSGKK